MEDLKGIDIHFHRSAYTCSQLHREEHQWNDQQKQLQPPIQHRFVHHSHCPSPPKVSPNNPKKFKKPIIRKNKAKKDETLCTMNMYLFLQEYAITLRIYIRALFKAQSRVEESVQEFNFVNLKRTLRKKGTKFDTNFRWYKRICVSNKKTYRVKETMLEILRTLEITGLL